MPKHIWTEVKVTPVEPVLNSATGKLDIYATEAAITAAEEDVEHVCGICDTTLTKENLNADCPGSHRG